MAILNTGFLATTNITGLYDSLLVNSNDTEFVEFFLIILLFCKQLFRRNDRLFVNVVRLFVFQYVPHYSELFPGYSYQSFFSSFSDS